MGGKLRLVLVGGGHAHMEVLRRLMVTHRPRFDLYLVSRSDRHHYSGMVPGYIRGTYSEEEISFDLPAFAEAAGGEFIPATATGVDPNKRVVRLEAGGEVSYDLVSFNVGSRLTGDDDPTVAGNATLVKPMSKAVRLHEKIREVANEDGRGPRRVRVVGGGAAGVEVACALAAVLDDAGCKRDVSILEASSQILSGYSEPFLRLAEDVLRDRSIEVRTESRVTRVRRELIETANGASIPSDLTVWLTGPAAQPVFQDSGLSTDKRGFLLVSDALQSVGDPRVFAAGDCATLVNYPDTPKAGVYAVRQAPVLWKSLVAAAEKTSPPRYEPQRGFLSLLNTCDGKALIRYKGYVGHNPWAWYLKDWIDRGFMKRYQRLV